MLVWEKSIQLFHSNLLVKHFISDQGASVFMWLHSQLYFWLQQKWLNTSLYAIWCATCWNTNCNTPDHCFQGPDRLLEPPARKHKIMCPHKAEAEHIANPNRGVVNHENYYFLKIRWPLKRLMDRYLLL